jgi:hypothetical protein
MDKLAGPSGNIRFQTPRTGHSKGCQPQCAAHFYSPHFLTNFLTNSQFSSEMIATLFEGLGAPSELCTDYISKSVSPKYLKHSRVLGLSNPSYGSRQPAGHVFVPGLK